MVATLFYTLAFIVLSFISVSYFIAYRVTTPKSMSVLGLLLFFLATNFVTLGVSINLWVYELTRNTYILPGAGLRGILLFLSALFVFYSTWFQRGDYSLEYKNDKGRLNEK